MTNPIAETLEMLEEKIENMKWLLISSYRFNRSGIFSDRNSVRKSSGILSKGPGGITFENKTRRAWRVGMPKRIG